MIDVMLRCRDCDSKPIIFASHFEPHEKTKIADTQHHMDINFKCRCGNCFACSWEVVKVKEVDFVCD